MDVTIYPIAREKKKKSVVHEALRPETHSKIIGAPGYHSETPTTLQSRPQVQLAFFRAGIFPPGCR